MKKKSTVATVKEQRRLRGLAPMDEVAQILMEATQSVEDMLRIEDVGWIYYSGRTGEIIDAQARQTNLLLSRLYYNKDPLGKQAIRLWTDYTFGPGITYSVEDEPAKKALKAFWEAPENKSVLGSRGQRKSSDKSLVDGEIFFALFLTPGGIVKIRWIDPLEIVEIITDPDDVEKVMYYRRDWSDTQAGQHVDYYMSVTNPKDEGAKDSAGAEIKSTQDNVLVYHLALNTISQRGNPLLLPALDWIKQYRRFLASRIAVMLALARFAWKGKVKGGQALVDAMKAKTHQKEIAAGSTEYENEGFDLTPIKTESGAAAAYQDGKMIKHQVFAAVGIPEQYFGDISTGNLATAKTVELPMMKMFQSYQKVWSDTYQDIDEIVLAHAGIKFEDVHIDRDFPKIAPSDIAQAAEALVGIIGAMPELGDSDDVKQIALMTLGVNDPAAVLAELEKLTKESGGNPDVALLKAMVRFKESMEKKGAKEKKND